MFSKHLLTSSLAHTYRKNTWVSFNWSPVDPLLESLSLPARSIRFRTPCFSVVWQTQITCVSQAIVLKEWDDGDIQVLRNVTSFTAEIRRVNTKWLLDDCSFICVLPTDLRWCSEWISRRKNTRRYEMDYQIILNFKSLSSCPSSTTPYILLYYPKVNDSHLGEIWEVGCKQLHCNNKEGVPINPW